MAQKINKDLLAVTTALITIAVLFMANSAFAESTSKTKIRINGETLVDETITGDGSQNNKVEVDIKNGVGTVKINNNGTEKTIQVTPRAENPNENENESDSITPNEDKEEEKDENETKTTETNDPNSNKPERNTDKPRDLIEAMIRGLDDLFEKIFSAFDN